MDKMNALMKLMILFNSSLFGSAFVLAVNPTPGSSFSPTTDSKPTSSSSTFSPTSHIPTAKSTATKMFVFPSQKKEAVATFAGKIAPVLEKLWITPEKAKNIVSAIKFVTEPADLIFILIVGWLLVPLVQIPYEKIYLKNGLEADVKRELDVQKNDINIMNTPIVKKPFLESKTYLITHIMSEAGRIAGLVYLVDCLAIAGEVLTFRVQDKSKLLAKTIYMAWAFLRMNSFRKFLVSKAFRYNGPDEKRRRRICSRARTVNNIFDVLLWGSFTATLLDVLQIKAGLFLNSFFAVGGAGTLILSFASKDMATQFVSGFALQASDKVYEGEEVLFGNGVKGNVLRMGILETLVKHSGEMVTAVPNKDLANQKITNLSRLKFSQVTQTLRLHFHDADKIPTIINEIRAEIRKTCPHVVTDGSRPFRIYWSSYGETALEVSVDVRMKTAPIGDAFYEGKQNILLAIHRALARLGVDLVPLDAVVSLSG